MSTSQRQLELISQNISNVNTPGYQALQSFQSVIEAQALHDGSIFTSDPANILQSLRSDAQGELKRTDGPFDLALASPGYFAVRNPLTDEFEYTRAGQFQRNADGYLLDPSGRVLQSESHHDLRVSAQEVRIAEDARLFEDGIPTDRLGVFAPTSPSDGPANLAEAMNPGDIQVMQGMIETSNISVAEEMVEMMAAIRQAEIGAQILQSYDTLLGQAISSLGRT